MAKHKGSTVHLYAGICNYVPIRDNPDGRTIIQRDVFFLRSLYYMYKSSDILYLTLTKEECTYAEEIIGSVSPEKYMEFRSIERDYRLDYEASLPQIKREFDTSWNKYMGRKKLATAGTRQCYYSKEADMLTKTIMVDYFTSRFNVRNEMDGKYGFHLHPDIHMDFLARVEVQPKDNLGRGLAGLT